MKSSLWVIIALVAGIVGFLMGYSLSATTGFKGVQTAHVSGTAEKSAQAPAANPAGYGGPAAGPAGYGAPQQPAAAAYGAPQPPAADAPKPATNAAGY